MNLSIFNKQNSPLAYKILLTILISSAIITAFIIAIQLRFEYKSDISMIEKRLNLIENSYSQSLALSIWNFNKTQYEIQLDGILNIEDIAYVNIVTPSGDEIISKGKYQKEKIVTKEILLKTVDFGATVEVGKLTVVASLDRVYDDLYYRALIIFTTQSIKTLIVSFVILLAFYILITRHLKHISNYARDIDLDSDDKLTLNRKINKKDDELDFIVFALNNMKEKIRNSYQMIKEINRDLENKVDIRTKELEKQKDKAQKATQAKSDFLANMSHEIRTPMNGILGMSYLVLETNLDDKQRDYVKQIDNSAKSLLGIINDILDFSKIEAGKLTIEKINFNLFNIMEDIISMMKIRANQKNIKLNFEYDNNLSHNFYGDSLRIGQIITNLLGNAIKFTNSGEVKLSIDKTNTNKIRFQVIDTGIGLTPDQQEKLFKSFSQADETITRKYGGTGLGLSISKNLVDLMNGKIWVESKIDKGSKFIFEIGLQTIENMKDYKMSSDKKDYIKQDNIINLSDEKEKLSDEKIIVLFTKLQDTLISKRPKQFKPIIQEIEQYNLGIKKEKLFSQVKNLVKEYELEDAIKLIQEII